MAILQIPFKKKKIALLQALYNHQSSHFQKSLQFKQKNRNMLEKETTHSGLQWHNTMSLYVVGLLGQVSRGNEEMEEKESARWWERRINSEKE